MDDFVRRELSLVHAGFRVAAGTDARAIEHNGHLSHRIKRRKLPPWAVMASRTFRRRSNRPASPSSP